MSDISISDALIELKSLKERYKELVALRNENAHAEKHFYGDNKVDKTPVYDVKSVDALVIKLAKAIRVLDAQIKRVNATTMMTVAVDPAVWEPIS